jgi:hypothetical protein
MRFDRTVFTKIRCGVAGHLVNANSTEWIPSILAGAGFTVVSPGNIAPAILDGLEVWVAKAQRVLDPGSEGHPYPVAFFAEKHGLSLKAAEVILFSNGPSHNACDAAARAFLGALELRGRY